MLARIAVRALAGALIAGTVAAAPAAAQSAVVRPVAIYNVANRNHDRTMPVRVTLADSAGKLVASYNLAADTTTHRMGVIFYGEDLVLVGETKRGVLEMTFLKQLDRPRGAVTGYWTRGSEEGLLRGRVK
jgi:hypothetical protein